VGRVTSRIARQCEGSRSENAAIDLPKSVLASRENALQAPFWSCHVDANDGSFFRDWVSTTDVDDATK
jgi:hypothetical protein